MHGEEHRFHALVVEQEPQALDNFAPTIDIHAVGELLVEKILQVLRKFLNMLVVLFNPISKNIAEGFERRIRKCGDQSSKDRTKEGRLERSHFKFKKRTKEVF